VKARRGVAVWVLVLSLAALSACERESRQFDPPAPGADVGSVEGTGDKAVAEAMVAHYERNAYALATGKRLFTWYNCSGCHANGGGGSGPALMDDVWIYGGDARSIYQTIAAGRPNGMPAFGTHIPKDQIWQLVAYVRSLAGLAPQDGAPNRDDAFLTRVPESFMDPQKPERAKPSSGSGRAQ
jgi:cytochrome c oxidase cbb3-type subunit 3